MDSDHKERVKAHYNSHVKDVTTAEALKQRREGPAAPLKEFHNEIKRRLIYRFAYRKRSLLDYACGRGGDLHKWKAAQIGYVKGIDLSPAEIREAERRFLEMKAKERGGLSLSCDFEQCEHLGDRHIPELEPFDVVTCMFAIHYFFDREETLGTFMRNVADSLKDGGYFIGTVPDGKRIMAHLAATGELDEPLLKLTKKWEGKAKKFGSAYVMEIRDTVVEGVSGESEGSAEFLVFSSSITKAAAAVGLHPVVDYQDPDMNRLFEEADAAAAFKHFKPNFPETSHPSLALASELYTAFVFQKAKGPDRVAPPPLPPPEVRRGGGRGGAADANGGGGGGGRGGGGGGGGGYGGGGGRRELNADQHPRFQPRWVQDRAAYTPPLPHAYAYVAAKHAHQRARDERRFVFAPTPPAWVAGVPNEVGRRYGYGDYRGQQEMAARASEQQQQQRRRGPSGAAVCPGRRGRLKNKERVIQRRGLTP